MADGDDPMSPRPRPPVPPGPGQPLPRLWKAEPEPEADEPGARKSRKERLAEEKEAANANKGSDQAATPASPRPKKQEASKPGPTGSAKREAAGSKPRPKGKGVLIEETPELDTYETRQRVRALVGIAVALAFVLGGIVLWRSIGGAPAEDEGLVDEGPPPGAAAPSPTTAAFPATPDQEAKNLLGTARQLAKNGKTDEAIAVLKRVGTNYPKSEAAAEAREALDRPSRKLPLFVDGSTVVAAPGPQASPASPGVASPVVTVDASAPSTVAPGGTGVAQLQLPPNPAETGSPVGTSAPTPAGVTARPLPAGFRARTEAGLHTTGWPHQIVSDRDGAVMVLVPGGKFRQGRDDGTPDEGPEHDVSLGTFYADQHEVTVRQYNLHLRETGRKPAGTARVGAKVESETPADELPVVNVTAREAKAYCEWAGKRLPTEAQWEAAARTTDGRLYPWGSNSPTWSRPRAPRQIDPAMSYPLDMSPYGAFDLAGNAWEWTRDWFDSKYYLTLRGQVVTNPEGPASSRARPPQLVVKGGSKGWFAPWREGLKVDTKLPYLGFRGVLDVDGPPGQASPAANAPASTRPANSDGVVPF